MINPNTDTGTVLSVLKETGSINEWYAMRGLGIKRLSARINDLKQHGYKIKTVLKKVTKRSGRVVNVTDRYEMESK